MTSSFFYFFKTRFICSLSSSPDKYHLHRQLYMVPVCPCKWSRRFPHTLRTAPPTGPDSAVSFSPFAPRASATTNAGTSSIAHHSLAALPHHLLLLPPLRAPQPFLLEHCCPFCGQLMHGLQLHDLATAIFDVTSPRCSGSLSFPLQHHSAASQQALRVLLAFATDSITSSGHICEYSACKAYRPLCRLIRHHHSSMKRLATMSSMMTSQTRCWATALMRPRMKAHASTRQGRAAPAESTQCAVYGSHTAEANADEA